MCARARVCVRVCECVYVCMHMLLRNFVRTSSRVRLVFYGFAIPRLTLAVSYGLLLNQFYRTQAPSIYHISVTVPIQPSLHPPPSPYLNTTPTF